MKRLFTYIAPLFFILSWWCIAFSKPSVPHKTLITHNRKLPFSSEVIPIDRERLFRALNGDFDLMTQLIVEWDLEAQLLQEKGYANILRLDREQILAILRQEIPVETASQHRYFPQTYLAAGILLALVDGSSLTSLPRGLRSLDRVYLPEKLHKIPNDSNPRFMETIGSSHDTVAFISPYSEPCTLNVMLQRGIPMVDLGCVATMRDLKFAIETVGQVTQTPGKADLLNTFIDATLTALDNHLATRNSSNHEILYVNHHTVFSVPTQKTLMGNILTRLDINRPFTKNQPDNWTIPLDIEDITAMNPDCIICSGHQTSPWEKLQDIAAAQSGQIHFVEPTTQGSQSQHFLLGYYDLYDILMRLP